MNKTNKPCQEAEKAEVLARFLQGGIGNELVSKVREGRVAV